MAKYRKYSKEFKLQAAKLVFARTNKDRVEQKLI